MIAGVSIQETKGLAACSGIDDLINAWEGERIIGAGFVEVCLVDTDTPSAVFLEDKHWVSQPFRMENFNDEPGS